MELENIRSYEKEKFYFDSDKILLSGDIGSGKSTLLYAVEFSFFGFIKGWVDGEKLLRKGKNFGSVKLEFELNGKKYSIFRSLKKNKSIVQNEIILEVDGFEKKLSSEEAKAFVLNLFNYPNTYLKKQPLIYRYTIFTPQEKMKEIVSENSDVRLNIIRKIFGIDKYNNVIENSKIFKDFINKRISFLEGKIFYKKEYEEKLSFYKDRKLFYESQIKLLEEKFEKLYSSFLILEKQYNDFLLLKEKKLFLEKNILEKSKELDNVKNNILEFENKIKILEEKIKSLEEKVVFKDEKNLEEKLKGLEDDIKLLEEKIKDLEDNNVVEELNSLDKTLKNF